MKVRTEKLGQRLPYFLRTREKLAQFFGAKVKGIPWMEVLNLCTAESLQKLITTPSW
jgi:hypothetical protein